MAIRHLQGNRLEIVMEDYEDIDTILNVDEFIDKYRIWQEFAAKQVVENIRCFTENDELLANNTNIEHNKMLVLLKELISSSSSLGVQLILLEALFLLTTKFPQRNLFNYGIVQLVNYIKHTRFNQVILAALKYLAELKNKSQYYDIDKQVVRQIDIDSLLTRVAANVTVDSNGATVNYQGEIMKLYNTIYSKTLMSDNGIFSNLVFSTNIPTMVTEYIIDLQQQIQELKRMGDVTTKEQREIKEQESKRLGQEIKQEAKLEWRLLAHAQADTKSMMMKSESKESGQMIDDFYDNEGGTRSRDNLLLAIDDVEEVKSISSRISTPSAKPIVSDSVALEKIIKLLTSVDTSVRTYALDKLVKMSNNNTSSKSSIGSYSDVDRSLNSLISAGPKGEQDLAELVSALMLCLQAALHRRAAASNGIMDELPQLNEAASSSSISEKALASFNANDTFRSTHNPDNMYETMKPLPLNKNTSTAELLISSALLSPHTDIASIKKCILCINSIISVSEWKNIATKTLTEWSRLLLTLTHAPNDMEDISESCAQYVLDIIGLTTGGWPAAKLRIESAALDKFLLEYNNLLFGEEAKSNPKQYRALMALSYISSLKLNTGSSTQSLPTTSPQRNSHTTSFRSLHSDDDSSIEFLEELLLNHSNKLLHICWNLILGKTEKAALMDLQIQSFAMDILATSSVRLTIREFLLRQQAIGKLLLLLHEVGLKLNAVGSSLQGTVEAHRHGKVCYELLLTRSTIKALTNLSTSNNNIMSQVRHVLVLGNHINTSNRELLHMFTTSNKALRQLSQLDETFGYYYDIIASFKDELTDGSGSGQKNLEKAEKVTKESSDVDEMMDASHPVYNLDHDGVAQRAWNLVKQKYKHK